MRTMRLLAVALFLVVAVLSITTTAWRTVRISQSDRETYGDLTPEQRVSAAADAIPLRIDIFDFFRDRLRPDDRYYLQVAPSNFGNVDKETAVETFGRYYLLPAVLVEDPKDADVVLAWDENPNDLGLDYEPPFDRAGVQDVYVARVRRGG